MSFIITAKTRAVLIAGAGSGVGKTTVVALKGSVTFFAETIHMNIPSYL